MTPKTIQHCWIKTDILPSYDDDMVNDDDDVYIQDYEDDDEIESLLNELPETDEILEYFQMLDHEIPTEEYLTDEQIINMMQADKENQKVEECENENDEIPVVSVKKAVSGLETFVHFFEQQDDAEFNNKDLRIFKKYLQVIQLKEFNSKKQCSFDLFFNDFGME